MVIHSLAGICKYHGIWAGIGHGLTMVSCWLETTAHSHTNHLYRVNSDWASIMQGIDIISQGPARLHWKTIVFQFNYNSLDTIKEFAE
jgi:hypothetical protein